MNVDEAIRTMQEQSKRDAAELERQRDRFATFIALRKAELTARYESTSRKA